MASTESHPPFQFFDPHAEFGITERNLPHWAQNGTLCFITWRTWDSMPRHVVREWTTERNSWLVSRGISPADADWKDILSRLPMREQDEYRQIMAERSDSRLDDCHGNCVLRQPEVAKIVTNSLHHFDGDRYVLSDFVIMPNHVHLLAAFDDADQMLKQCESWKHYTATRINRLLGRSGRFWQVDGFDHLVRSEEQFNYYRTYIANNPKQARLKPEEFMHYTRT